MDDGAYEAAFEWLLSKYVVARKDEKSNALIEVSVMPDDLLYEMQYDNGEWDEADDD